MAIKIYRLFLSLLNLIYTYIFVRLQDLRRLSLANNLIEKLAHRVFYKVSKLKYLDLSENPLTDLPPDHVFTDITVRMENRWKMQDFNTKLVQRQWYKIRSLALCNKANKKNPNKAHENQVYYYLVYSEWMDRKHMGMYRILYSKTYFLLLLQSLCNRLPQYFFFEHVNAANYSLWERCTLFAK